MDTAVEIDVNSRQKSTPHRIRSRVSNVVYTMAAEATDVPKITSATVPDLEAIARFIREMIARGAIAALVTALVALFARMRDLNVELVARLAHGRRRHPPSESLRRLQQEQLSLFKDDVATGTPRPNKPRPSKPRKDPPRRDPHGRGKLPEHLQRRVEEILVPDDARPCPRCGATMRTVGFKCCSKLELVPAHFILVEEKREVVACPAIECRAHMETAPKPDQIVDRGKLGTELIVQALVDHYRDGVPWERMSRNARDQGVRLPANVLARSVWCALDLLDPVIRHITHKTLTAECVSFDATSLPVLDRAHPMGIRIATMWGLIGDNRWALFIPAPSGHGEHLKKRLGAYTLALTMCDGGSANNAVHGPTTQRGGCHSHGRGKVVEAHRGGDPRALEGIEIYAELFAVEARSKEHRETHAQRLERRQRDSQPIVDRLRAWVDARLLDVEPKSALGKAVRYLRNQWERLTLFLTEGALELTNNAAERLLRTLVIDRKSWLFVGCDASAQHTADALTLVMTCRHRGIDPRCYLRDTLKRILAGVTDPSVLWPENYVPLVASPS